jgi:hypothetical protein
MLSMGKSPISLHVAMIFLPWCIHHAVCGWQLCSACMSEGMTTQFGECDLAVSVLLMRLQSWILDVTWDIHMPLGRGGSFFQRRFYLHTYHRDSCVYRPSPFSQFSLGCNQQQEEMESLDLDVLNQKGRKNFNCQDNSPINYTSMGHHFLPTPMVQLLLLL